MAIVMGEVSLNGNKVTRSCAVFDGDRLITRPSAAVVLHLAGSILHVGPSSEVCYRGKTLELISGAAEVQGSEAVMIAAFSISPVGKAHFSLKRERALTSLLLVSGNVKLSRGKETATLTSPGRYTLHHDGLISATKQHGAIEKGAMAGGAAGTATVIGHWLANGKGDGTTESCVSEKSPSSCR